MNGNGKMLNCPTCGQVLGKKKSSHLWKVRLVFLACFAAAMIGVLISIAKIVVRLIAG